MKNRTLIALLVTQFWLGIALTCTASDIQVIKDVSYGPHARNVMDFYLPTAGPKPRPLVVCIHGGGWAGGNKQSYAWLGDALAREGFAAVSLTYRFAPAWRAPAQMDDVQRAVRWLRKHAAQYGLDPDRIGAIGGSAGGHLASYLALTETRDNSDPELAAYSSRVQCVVDCYGPVDLVEMMQSASAPIVQGFLGKPLEGHEEDYRKASPISYVSSNPPPFLIVHGARDLGTSRGQVPLAQSVVFYEKLVRAGGQATLLKLEGAGHGFTGNGSNQYAQETLTAAVKFFTKHLTKPRVKVSSNAPFSGGQAGGSPSVRCGVLECLHAPEDEAVSGEEGTGGGNEGFRNNTAKHTQFVFQRLGITSLFPRGLGASL